MRFETIHPIFIVKITLILEFFGSGFTGLTVFVNSLIMSTINHFQSEIFHRTSVYVFTSMNYFLQWVFKLMFNQRLLLVDQSENELIRKQSWQQSNFGTSSRIGLLLCHSWSPQKHVLLVCLELHRLADWRSWHEHFLYHCSPTGHKLGVFVFFRMIQITVWLD